MKFIKISLLSLLLVPVLTNAQKIKYKDIFPFLNSKIYNAENEANLKSFLAQEKKSHANANLQLAFIMEDKFLKMNILKDTVKVALLRDSTIDQFKKTVILITEKEIKKNKAYYQDFYRRDLRTGEFGIKISDIHLEIEKKIEAISQRSKDIHRMNRLIYLHPGKNNFSAGVYKKMTEKAQIIQELRFALSDNDMILIDSVVANGEYFLFCWKISEKQP